MTQPPPWPDQPSAGGGAPDPPPQPPPQSPPYAPPPSLPPPGTAPPQPLYPGTSYGAPSTPPPGYGYGYPPPFPPAQRTNGMAIAGMVVSIVAVPGLCFYGVGGFLAILGAILGHVGRRQAKARNEAGDGMALAGIIVGWITTALAVIITTLWVVFVVWAVGNDPAFQSPPDQF